MAIIKENIIRDDGLKMYKYYSDNDKIIKNTVSELYFENIVTTTENDSLYIETDEISKDDLNNN